jgi:hypothetical protein
LHIFEGSNWEGAGQIGVHHPGVGVGKCGKTKNILHRACILRGEHTVNLVSGGDDDR